MYRNWGRVSAVVAAIICLFYLSNRIFAPSIQLKWKQPAPPERYLQESSSSKQHPIEILVQESKQRFQRIVDRQSKSLEDAIVEYQRRYQQEPPPNFEAWYNVSVQHNSILIDDTYDSILRDLEPFMKLSTRDLHQRTQAVVDSKNWFVPFEIKNHTSLKVEDDWRTVWMVNVLKEYAEHLPDMKIPYNRLPEPRLAVPWENVPQNNPECLEISTSPKIEEFSFLNLSHLRPWNHAVRACPSSAPVRLNNDGILDSEESLPQMMNDTNVAPEHLRFVRDVPLAKDLCQNPEVERQHGLLVSPDNMFLATDLVPIFSRDRLSSFRDILVPTPTYGRDTNDDGDMPWDDKVNSLYWAGTTTGGYQHDGSWKFTQRFRFVSLLNDKPRPIALLQRAKSQESWESFNSTIAEISSLVDVKFTKHKLCAEEDCKAQKKDPTLRFGKAEKPEKFKGHRLVMDVDGQGSTDRFYKLLRSKSTVLKQTLCQEWHDERLIPWVHYVPISMHMEELPEVIRFLTEEDAGQKIAKDIALQGREFAHQALRDVDRGLYLFRLLLEWGRVIDPTRDEHLPLCPSG